MERNVCGLERPDERHLWNLRTGPDTQSGGHPSHARRLRVAPENPPCKRRVTIPLLSRWARRWEFQQVASIPGIRIAADAELLNRPELTRLLKRADFDSASLTPAELLARLYRELGVSFVERLDGVFLSLFGTRRTADWSSPSIASASIVCIGVKRATASSLLPAWGPSATLRKRLRQSIRAALVQYMLFSAVPAPMVIYQGIEKLRPGTFLIYEAGQVRQTRYWDLQYRESENHNVTHWASEVREGMRSAVQNHLTDLTPEKTGAYLSGGTDSSSASSPS